MEGKPLKRAYRTQHPMDIRMLGLIEEALASSMEAEAMGDYDSATLWDAEAHRINKEMKLLQEFRDELK
jgi:hypothetical protein